MRQRDLQSWYFEELKRAETEYQYTREELAKTYYEQMRLVYENEWVRTKWREFIAEYITLNSFFIPMS